jgi:hypothetical protein
MKKKMVKNSIHSVLSVFFLVACSAQQEFSLLRIIRRFDTLIDGCKNNEMRRQFVSYQKACVDARNAIAHDTDVADHIWYRAEIAKTICFFGFDIFKQIKSYLGDWNKLIQIKNITPDHFQHLSAQWAGRSFGFEENEITSDHKLSLFDQNTNDQYNLEEIRNLLQVPKNGTLFHHGSYYGKVDYEKQKAILYDRSGDDTRKINFSKYIPWDDLKIAQRSAVFFHHDTFCLTFWPFFGERKAEGQIVYQIRKITDDVDLSVPASYNSSAIQIRWIDGSVRFVKYSHAWFSFHIFNFFTEKPIRKTLKADSFVKKLKFGLFFVGNVVLMVVITAYGLLATYVALATKLQKINFLISGFSALLVTSFYWRGVFRSFSFSG